MADNSRNFYLSGLISLSFFALILFSFIIMMFKPSKIDTFALKKDNFISISLEIPKVQTKSVKKQEKAAVIQESVEVPNENIDVNNLFSDVWTKKIVHKKEPKKEVNSKRLSEIQKKIKTTKKNEVKSMSQKVNNLDNVKTNSENANSSTADQVNEYLAKIQAIVYEHFHVPSNSEGNSVKTVIELNSLGKVIDFRILTYSANEALNSEADRIRERLKYIIFPKNPQNKSSRTIVILVSKESN